MYKNDRFYLYCSLFYSSGQSKLYVLISGIPGLSFTKPVLICPKILRQQVLDERQTVFGRTKVITTGQAQALTIDAYYLCSRNLPDLLGNAFCIHASCAIAANHANIFFACCRIRLVLISIQQPSCLISASHQKSAPYAAS